MGAAELLTSLVAVLILYCARKRLQEAIENFRNYFGGGPPSPMHPLPGDDAVIVRRKRQA
jgi:hypothetical protein